MDGHFVRAICKMVGQCPYLVGKCLMSDHYFKYWVYVERSEDYVFNEDVLLGVNLICHIGPK